MSYHIEIATERRTPRQTDTGFDYSRLAHQYIAMVPTGNVIHTVMGDMQEHVAGATTLYCCSDAALPDHDWSDPQFINVAEWDLKSPFVILHKGSYTPRFAGWPELTKEEYDALPALAPI